MPNINLGLLERYGCDKNTATFMYTYYPNGADLSIILKDKNDLPHEFLSWIKYYIPMNNEEIQLWTAACHIDEQSESISNSFNIERSKWIMNSNNVSDSENIIDSQEITSSFNCLECDSIDNSQSIISSSYVTDSNYIELSTNVNSSSNIVLSQNIINSSNVCSSSSITNSDKIIHSHNLNNCIFCSNCKDLVNCAFCYDLKLSGAEYLIFNEKVTPEIYNQVINWYNKKFKKEKLNLWYEDRAVINPTKQFDSLPQAFYKWITTVPNYNPLKLYNLTFQPKLIK